MQPWRPLDAGDVRDLVPDPEPPAESPDVLHAGNAEFALDAGVPQRSSGSKPDMVIWK